MILGEILKGSKDKSTDTSILQQNEKKIAEEDLGKRCGMRTLLTWSFLILSNPHWPLSTWSGLLAGSTLFPWELHTTATLGTLCHSLLTGACKIPDAQHSGPGKPTDE